MKILVLSSSFPRYSGDFAGNFVYELTTRLKKYGFEVIILAPHDSGARFRENMEGLLVYRFPYFYPYSIQKLSYGSGISYNLKKTFLAKIQVPLFFLSELLGVIRIAKKEKIKIINSHWLMPQGLVGAVYKRFFGASHVITVHSSEITLLKKIPSGKKIAEFIVNNTDAILSVSSHRANELLDFISPKVSAGAKNKIQIIPMGVTLNEIRTGGNKEELKLKYRINSKFVVLFVGRLVEVKGCEYLIRSFRHVVDNFNNVQLIIIGTGSLEAELKKMVQELDLRAYIRFEGFVGHNKIGDYYSMSNINIFPSIVDSSGFEEGLPVVLLEALTAGKPVIATRTKGGMEVIEDDCNGILIEPKNPEQIADAILMLLNNHQLREKLSKNALESSKKYDWENISNQYNQIFKFVTNS